MLFNTTTFVFIFMPIVFFGFFLIARIDKKWAMVWLAGSSLFFYGFWSIVSLPILLGSVCVNYWLSTYITRTDFLYRKIFFIFAVIGNLLILGYYKYANFFIDNLNEIRYFFDLTALNSVDVLLPIGISFFTFTQIAFLIDSYRGVVKEKNFIDYIVFVSFFPHLLAGPLLHHKSMMPQFSITENFKIQLDKVGTGLIIFTIGLAKKILIADTLNSYVSNFYVAVGQTSGPSFGASWVACLAYTFQMYFDFSGYSDMAVGASLLFGIWLPYNFNSPFKATSVIDFWQRWHMSLTKYIGDYLYTPLMLASMRWSQNMNGVIESLFSLILPTMIVFIVVGFWHGASWTYVMFGVMHGVYLVVNHLWRRKFPLPNKKSRLIQKYKLLKKTIAWLLTFLAVSWALVMFRSDSVSTAVSVYRGMLGLNGFSLGAMTSLNSWVYELRIILMVIGISLFISLVLPNTIRVVEVSSSKLKISQLLSYFPITISLGFIFILLQVKIYESPFLYFQF